MRIAISASGSSLDAPLEVQFEKCSCLVIADLEGDAIHDPVRNPHWNLASGVGIQVPRLLVERGVSVVLTGRCEPKTVEHLESAGLWVVTGCSGTVRQVLEKFTADLNEPSEVETEFPPPVGKTAVDPARRSNTFVGGGRRIRRRRDRGVGGGFESGDAGNWHVGGLGGI